MESVKSPSTASMAVAPFSVYLAFFFFLIIWGLGPVSVRTGGSVSRTAVAVPVDVCVLVWESVPVCETVTVTIAVPVLESAPVTVMVAVPVPVVETGLPLPSLSPLPCPQDADVVAVTMREAGVGSNNEMMRADAEEAVEAESQNTKLGGLRHDG